MPTFAVAGQSKLSNIMLPHEKVAAMARIYGRPAAIIPIEKCCGGVLNRGISFKYMNSMLERIVNVEGFSPLRYKEAMAIEPDPRDPFASNRRHQEEA